MQVTPIKLEDIVDLLTEPYHPQSIQQLAVQCKAQRCYESQSRQPKNESEKKFSTLPTVNGTTHMTVLSREIHEAVDRNVTFGDQPIKHCTAVALPV